MQKLFRTLFLIGFALLPFSNRTKEFESYALFTVDIPFVTGLYSPGLLVLWLASIAGFVSWFQRGAPSSGFGRIYSMLGLCYVGLVFALLPATPNLRASSIRASSHFLGFMLFVLLILHDWRPLAAVRSSGMRSLGFVALTLSGAVLSMYYITNTAFQASFGGLQDVIYSRFIGGINSLPWGASNIVASVLLMSFSSAVLLFNSIGGSSKMLVIICAIGAGILATLSRNSIVCLVLTTAIYAVVRGQRRLLWISGIGLFVGGIWSFLRRQDLMGDIVDTRAGDLGEVMSAGGRIEIWGYYLDRLYERPLGFNGLYSSIVEFGFSPHNWFLVTYWELGILGLVAGLSLVFGPIVQLWRKQAAGRRGVTRSGLLTICIALVVFLNLQSEDPQFSHQYIVSWWVWLGALVQEANQYEASVPATIPRGRRLGPVPGTSRFVAN